MKIRLYDTCTSQQRDDDAENIPAAAAAPEPQQQPRAVPTSITKHKRTKRRKTNTMLPNGNTISVTDDTEISDYDISEFTQL